MKQLAPLIILLIISLLSCNNEEICLSNQDAVQVKFYSYYSTTDKDTSLEHVSIYGLGRTDSLYADTTISKAFLPLNFDSDPGTTTYVIQIDEVKDTITFAHSKELDFVSGDCGYVFKFALDAQNSFFTPHNIDNVVVVNPSIKYGEDAENVKIYIY
jgi:hypothetical protein